VPIQVILQLDFTPVENESDEEEAYAVDEIREGYEHWLVRLGDHYLVGSVIVVNILFFSPDHLLVDFFLLSLALLQDSEVVVGAEHLIMILFRLDCYSNTTVFVLLDHLFRCKHSLEVDEGLHKERDADYEGDLSNYFPGEVAMIV